MTESSELFGIFIDSLFSLPTISNIKNIRVAARLCYGNQTKARQMTQPMSFVRNSYHNENVSLKPQVRFNQWLLFDDARLCELQREALLVLEVYASFLDDFDTSLSYEMYDGVPMRLIGWCSQALFDHEHRLITGERYLGVFDAATTNRTGFYSLRNVFERNCPILSVSFLDQSSIWPDIQARNDVHAGNFTEISREKQEQLCRLLKRPSLLLSDHTALTTVDNRKQPSPINPPEEGRIQRRRTTLFTLLGRIPERTHVSLVFQNVNSRTTNVISSGLIVISSFTNRMPCLNYSSLVRFGTIPVSSISMPFSTK